MDERVKFMWEAALLSGDFRQGTRRLKVGGSQGEHCCLGVLCELYIQEHPGKARFTNYTDDNGVQAFVEGKFSTGRTAMPSANVREWAGISQEFAGRLACLNDNGSDFERIAQLIDEEGG